MDLPSLAVAKGSRTSREFRTSGQVASYEIAVSAFHCRHRKAVDVSRVARSEAIEHDSLFAALDVGDAERSIGPVENDEGNPLPVKGQELRCRENTGEAEGCQKKATEHDQPRSHGPSA